MAVACESGARRMTPLMFRLWSSEAPGFRSENTEVEAVIDAPPGTTLVVNGLDGAVADLAGNAFAGSVAKTFDGTVVDGVSAYAIAYDLAGGDPGPDAPASYTSDETVELVAPTREGYVFAGWTGSCGDIPLLSVAIPAGSHGDRGYAAVWAGGPVTPDTKTLYGGRIMSTRTWRTTAGSSSRAT